MNNEIIRKVNSLHDLLIDDEHISAVLSGQETILPPEVQKAITSATHLHANSILNQLQKEQHRIKAISLEELPEDQQPTTPVPVLRETEFEFEEERLARAFSTLSADRQRLLTLLFLYDLKPEEAAEMLHYSIKKAYNSKYEALKKLRTIL